MLQSCLTEMVMYVKTNATNMVCCKKYMVDMLSTLPLTVKKFYVLYFANMIGIDIKELVLATCIFFNEISFNEKFCSLVCLD